MRPVIALVCMSWLLVGCTSMRSTLLHRGESNQGWEKERFLGGVPVTLKVPTHLKVEVYEHHFLVSSKMAPASSATSDSDDSADQASPPDVQWLEMGVPIRSVNTQLVETEKIFTVDTKRPGAGTMNATLGFTGQYFNKIDYTVDDDTLEDVTALIGKIARSGLIGAPTTDDGQGTLVDTNVQQVDSVVASALFELDAPDLEWQIRAFLHQHLNGCHTCRITPPGVVTPKRLPPIPAPACLDTHDPSPACCPEGHSSVESISVVR